MHICVHMCMYCERCSTEKKQSHWIAQSFPPSGQINSELIRQLQANKKPAHLKIYFSFLDEFAAFFTVCNRSFHLFLLQESTPESDT